MLGHRSTLIVASVIQLRFVGGVVALLFNGYTLSFTAMITPVMYKLLAPAV